MEMFVRILQFVGVLNVAFITLNGSYQISSEYFSNTTMITILVILVVISFVKDLLNFIGIEMPYKPLDYFFRLATLVVAGILSSFVILIPKLILIRSEEHTSELQSRPHLVCRLLLEKKKKNKYIKKY